MEKDSLFSVNYFHLMQPMFSSIAGSFLEDFEVSLNFYKYTHSENIHLAANYIYHRATRLRANYL